MAAGESIPAAFAFCSRHAGGWRAPAP